MLSFNTEAMVKPEAVPVTKVQEVANPGLHRFLALKKKTEESALQAEVAKLAAQVEALTARLEALHAAQLLSDDEMFGLEDTIADFVEARASFGVVTMETVHTNRVVGKMHKLIAVSEGMPKDAMLARQLRRKFA